MWRFLEFYGFLFLINSSWLLDPVKREDIDPKAWSMKFLSRSNWKIYSRKKIEISVLALLWPSRQKR